MDKNEMSLTLSIEEDTETGHFYITLENRNNGLEIDCDKTIVKSRIPLIIERIIKENSDLFQ